MALILFLGLEKTSDQKLERYSIETTLYVYESPSTCCIVPKLIIVSLCPYNSALKKIINSA